MYLGANCNPPQNPGEVASSHFTHLLPPVYSSGKTRLPESLWEELVHKSGAENFCSCHPRDGHPDHVALIANGLALMSRTGL